MRLFKSPLASDATAPWHSRFPPVGESESGYLHGAYTVEPHPRRFRDANTNICAGSMKRTCDGNVALPGDEGLARAD
ncbi:unnamed protein product [Mesocestoides corti]|uniref:Uncharacterized protein n=1 Tax=Mesocestoides corti TaxID=53468 RepID=A0A0R3UQL5_MESCO|nr:unnamed protein product [Mesocestoides corti]